MRERCPLLLLSALGLCTGRRACSPDAPRPRLHVLDLPNEFQQPPATWRMPNVFLARLKRSPFVEDDGDCADFYYLPHFGPPVDRAKAVRMLRYVRARWPYWNRSVAERPQLARHILYLPCDHGPADCVFGRPLTTVDPELNELHANPASSERQSLHLLLNGMADHVSARVPRRAAGAVSVKRTCHTCFARGVDIRLPTPHRHLCGPLCGYSMADLRARSPWHMPRSAGDAALRAARDIEFFWAGSSRHRGDTRAVLLSAHASRAGWRVLDVSKLPRGVRRPDLSVEMANADFCGSPPGWDGGDSDRYLPAILFGCVPVFFSTAEARPLEELVPEMDWSRVSVAITPQQVPRLHEVLAAITPVERVHMRLAMRSVWPRLLFSSFPVSNMRMGRKKGDWADAMPGEKNASYLGEDGSDDAFDGVMRILRMRVLRHERRSLLLPDRRIHRAI